MPDKITPALMLDKARELRAAGWWTPPGFDQIKAACFSAAGMLEQLAAEAKRRDPLDVADLRREVSRLGRALGDLRDVAQDAVQLAGGDQADEAMKELDRVLNE